ncbi:hypothetical protein RvY_07755 [Ramazzottius varieornatus]|uniref:Glycogen [starch] synthase n=1 Tax=Ramazzottius varieornatus TaxID=947166 RepID=A0A1D1VCQ6_RAMVA|nr:hypothetical protein RvY_07755 [Ramazzottius varieornatus]
MLDDKTDAVLMEVRRCRLFNHPSDRVKVIFHPQFLSPSSPVLPMEYDEFVHGCHLGVFPSSYEPWGYTPAECAVIGVPSITTNLSGFGCFIEELIPNPADFGIFLVDRKYKSAEQAIEQLTGYIHSFTKLSGSERRLQRRKTELLRNVLDWKTLGYAYRKARNMALQMLPKASSSASRPGSASSKAPSRPSTGRSSRPAASRPSSRPSSASAKGKPVKTTT